MTVKKKFALDFAWKQLQACCEEHGRMVTAGELAKCMGVTRNTAHNRLREMLEEGAIESEMEWRGFVAHQRFGVYGFKFGGLA